MVHRGWNSKVDIVMGSPDWTGMSRLLRLNNRQLSFFFFFTATAHFQGNFLVKCCFFLYIHLLLLEIYIMARKELLPGNSPSKPKQMLERCRDQPKEKRRGYQWQAEKRGAQKWVNLKKDELITTIKQENVNPSNFSLQRTRGLYPSHILEETKVELQTKKKGGSV